MTTSSNLLGAGPQAVQRGVISVPAFPGTATATVQPVGPRAVLAHLGATQPGVMLALTDPTTITATNGSPAPALVSWQLIDHA